MIDPSPNCLIVYGDMISKWEYESNGYYKLPCILNPLNLCCSGMPFKPAEEYTDCMLPVYDLRSNVVAKDSS